VEVFCLESNTNGRSCENHDCCGENVQLGIRVMFTLVNLFEIGAAVAVHSFDNGSARCLIGYCSNSFLMNADYLIRRTALVEKLFKDDNNAVITDLFQTRFFSRY